jgi:hypothetical protein
MTNILLTKILVGFFAVSLLSISIWLIFKLISIICRVLKFKLTFDDFMTIIWISAVIYCFYFIGDLLI